MMKYFLCLMLFCGSLSWANSNKVTPQETGPELEDKEGVALLASEGPIITVKSKSQTKQFTRRQLMDSSFKKQIVTENDPTYKTSKLTYWAIPVAQIFADFKITTDTTIAFYCLDGFSAPISAERLLNSDPSKSIAYLAIEDPKNPWPTLKNKKTAGPYYLIWEYPEKSQISKEEWPFQLAGFEIKGTLAEQFPHTLPEKIKDSDPVMKGYRSFMKNCFACHTMNGEGLANMGPDLNLPYNPTEYLVPKYFEILVRKPTGLRKWPNSKMSAFSKENLSDDELKSLTEYLKYMAKHKYESK